MAPAGRLQVWLTWPWQRPSSTPSPVLRSAAPPRQAGGTEEARPVLLCGVACCVALGRASRL